MSYPISDVTQGLIELAGDVSQDPAKQDWYDVHEYLELIPNSARVLKELIHYMHGEFL